MVFEIRIRAVFGVGLVIYSPLLKQGPFVLYTRSLCLCHAWSLPGVGAIHYSWLCTFLGCRPVISFSGSFSGVRQYMLCSWPAEDRVTPAGLCFGLSVLSDVLSCTPSAVSLISSSLQCKETICLWLVILPLLRKTRSSPGRTLGSSRSLQLFLFLGGHCFFVDYCLHGILNITSVYFGHCLVVSDRRKNLVDVILLPLPPPLILGIETRALCMPGKLSISKPYP